MRKIISLSCLRNIGGVLAPGCFDLLHIGHIRHLIAAKAMMPEGPLTVALTADRFIAKGAGRPAFSEQIRAEWVAALECVDYVTIIEDATGIPAIVMIRPKIYVRGIEYDTILGVSGREIAAVIENGGHTAYTDLRPVYSSRRILSGEYLGEKH